MLFAHYLDDKSFGEVVFTKLKRTKHERPGPAVDFFFFRIAKFLAKKH